MSYQKYHSSKAQCCQGHIHDSKKEARRCNELSFMEKAGEISGLRQQVKYVLIPTQRDFNGGWYSKGEKKGQPKPGKVIEKECSYYADFVYVKNGREIVEDVKGYKAGQAYEVFKLKKKLMLYIHGIRVREI